MKNFTTTSESFHCAGTHPDTGEQVHLYSVNSGVPVSNALDSISTDLVSIKSVMEEFDDDLPCSVKYFLGENLGRVIDTLNAVMEGSD